MIKRCIERIHKEDLEDNIPLGIRGIYVLYKKRGARFEVVYVGMVSTGRRSGIRDRIRGHRKTKDMLFTHFSACEVWDNISNDEVIELEGLFRHIYRNDPRANKLNIQRGFKKLKRLDRIDRTSQ